MFEIPVGSVLTLDTGDWSLGPTVPGTYPILLRVRGVRYETAAQFHDRQVWVDGTRLGRDGMPVEPMSLLVTRAALLRALRIPKAS